MNNTDNVDIKDQLIDLESFVSQKSLSSSIDPECSQNWEQIMVLLCDRLYCITHTVLLSLFILCYVVYIIWLVIVIVSTFETSGKSECVKDMYLISYVIGSLVQQFVYIYLLSVDYTNNNKIYHVSIQISLSVLLTIFGITELLHQECSNPEGILYLTVLYNVIAWICIITIIILGILFIIFEKDKNIINTTRTRSPATASRPKNNNT